MTTPEEIPSAKIAIEREARRRKQVYMVFVVLLAIPIAIGLYAIAKAPSETDVVVQRVAPIVEESVTARVDQKVDERIDQKIEPRVQEVVARNATPIIQQTLNTQLERQLDRAVVARVRPLEQQFQAFSIDNPQQQRMSARVKELEARVAALERRLEALSGGGRVPITHVPVPQR